MFIVGNDFRGIHNNSAASRPLSALEKKSKGREGKKENKEKNEVGPRARTLLIRYSGYDAHAPVVSGDTSYTSRRWREGGGGRPFTYKSANPAGALEEIK